MKNAEEIKAAVRERYAGAANAARGMQKASCCGGGGCSPAAEMPEKDFISRNLYDENEVDGLPLTAHLASLGCGNPTALAELNAGEVVLDLGSGGGIDVLLSARRVGPTGYVYGVDMTDEMLQLAEHNRAEAGVTNVEFRRGDIEHLPLPDNTVDVIISNCVINLAADKDRVLREAFRVLKPGGRFAVSDMVVDGALPEAVVADMMSWSGCIAGALSVDDYMAKLAAAGFVDLEITPTRVHSMADIANSGATPPLDNAAAGCLEANGNLWSAFIRAVKPAA